MIRTLLVSVASAGLLIAALPQPARASAIDDLTMVTFNHPIALPDVALPAGTYRFELADPTNGRDIVRVMNADGTVSYGQFLTIPTVARQTDKLVTLEKRLKGSPEAVEAWFYPGSDIGRQFVYPQTERFQG